MTIQISVGGTTGGGCEQTIQDSIETVSGVKSARPDRTTDIATLEGDGEIDSLGRAVEDAGDIVVD